MNEFLRNLIYDDAGKISPAKLATAGAGLAALYGVAKPDSGIGRFMGTSSNQRPVGYSEGIPEYGITRSLVPNAFSTMTPAGTPRRPGSGGRRYFTDTTYTPTGKTMSSAINPVNVPAQTQTGGGTPTPAPAPAPAPAPTTGGLFDSLTREEAMYLLNTLFGGDGTNTTTTGSKPPSNPTPIDPNTILGPLVGPVTPGQMMGNPYANDPRPGATTLAQGGAVPASRGYYLGGATDGMADEIPATIEDTQPAALSDGEFVVPADVVSGLGNGNSDAGAKVLYSMMDRVRQARTGTKEQGRKIAPNKFTPA